MAAETVSFMESRFGTDFSDVRIHTGGEAAQLSRDLDAQAFTVGNDIYFNNEKFAPESAEGRHLLAHELTHTIQQGGIVGRKIQKLGANPGCTDAETQLVHQAVFDANAWIRNALSKLESAPPAAQVRASLRRNFGPNQGSVANIPLIAGRLRTARAEMNSVPISCAGVEDATCAESPCGYTPGAGAHRFVMCRDVSLNQPDVVYRTACVVHESFHSAFSFMAIDNYSGWHGHSDTTDVYPGPGIDPLLNADSYATLVIDLS